MGVVQEKRRLQVDLRVTFQNLKEACRKGSVETFFTEIILKAKAGAKNKDRYLLCIK